MTGVSVIIQTDFEILNIATSKTACTGLLLSDTERPMGAAKLRRFKKELAATNTEEEIAECVLRYFDPLYQAYGGLLLPALRDSLSPTAWTNQGILIEPEEGSIPPTPEDVGILAHRS